MSFKDNMKSFGSSLPTTVGNGIIGGAFNLATSAFNARLAELAAQNEYNRQLDFWQKQNEYNTPLNQRKRLEQAGFNPAAAINGVAGNNTAGGLSSVPANEVDKRGRVDLNALNNSIALLGQMESVGANTDLLRRQIELSFYEQIIKNNQAYGLDIDNKTKEHLLKWLPFQQELTFEKLLAEISNIKSDTDLNIAKTDLSESERILNLAQTDYTAALTQSENSLRDAKAALMSAQTSDALASAERNLKEAAAVKFRVMFERNEDMRRNLQERRAQGLYQIEKQIAQYAADLGASDAELAKIRQGVADIWYDADRPDVINAILDFVHSNVRLGGSAVYSKGSNVSYNHKM